MRFRVAERYRRWAYQRSYSTSSPVSTRMGDRLRAGISPRYVTRHPGQLSGTENEYRPKCGDALRLGSKGRMAISFVDERVDGR